MNCSKQYSIFIAKVFFIEISNLKMYSSQETVSNSLISDRAKVFVDKSRNLFKTALYLVYLDKMVQGTIMSHD